MPSTVGIVASGNYGFSPADLSPQAWFDASDTSTITSSGGLVSQWNNKGSLGSLTQTTSSAQPGTGSVTQNGLNVLTFDGGDALAGSTASEWKFLSDGTVVLLAVVAQFGTSSDPNARYGLLTTVQSGVNATSFIVIYDDRASVSRNNRLLHLVGNSNVPTEAVFNLTSDNAITPNAASLVTAIQNPLSSTASARSSLYVNSGSVIANSAVTGAVTSGNPGSALTVGREQSPATSYFTGRVMEIVVASGSNATEANRVKLRDYLNAKWAVY